jgi:hypothetical protein
MLNFCTLFDSKYLVKGLALLDSMRETMPDSQLIVLACDDLTFNALHKFTPYTVVHLSAVETPEVKASRTWREYLWTLGSVFLLHCYNAYSGPWSYVDADCFFFQSIEPWSQRARAYHCAIIPHRYDAKHKDRLAGNGRFNVSWVYISDTDEGWECLHRWNRQCLEWCYYRQEDGKFADQGYLDEWPERYNTLIVEEAGVGLGPWGVLDNHYEMDGDTLLVNGGPLVFYHFSGLKEGKGKIHRGGYSLPGIVQRKIYDPYEARLVDIRGRLQDNGVDVGI